MNQLAPEFDEEFPLLLNVPYAVDSAAWQAGSNLLHMRSDAGSSGLVRPVHHTFWSRRVGGLVPRAGGPAFHYHFLSQGRSPVSCCGFGPGGDYGVASDGAGSTNRPIKHRRNFEE